MKNLIILKYKGFGIVMSILVCVTSILYAKSDLFNTLKPSNENSLVGSSKHFAYEDPSYVKINITCFSSDSNNDGVAVIETDKPMATFDVAWIKGDTGSAKFYLSVPLISHNLDKDNPFSFSIKSPTEITKVSPAYPNNTGFAVTNHNGIPITQNSKQPDLNYLYLFSDSGFNLIFLLVSNSSTWIFSESSLPTKNYRYGWLGYSGDSAKDTNFQIAYNKSKSHNSFVK